MKRIKLKQKINKNKHNNKRKVHKNNLNNKKKFNYQQKKHNQ